MNLQPSTNKKWNNKHRVGQIHQAKLKFFRNGQNSTLTKLGNKIMQSKSRPSRTPSKKWNNKKLHRGGQIHKTNPESQASKNRSRQW